MEAKESSPEGVDDHATASTSSGQVTRSAYPRCGRACLHVCQLFIFGLLLYVFFISLGLMQHAFELLGGSTAGEMFRHGDIYDSPIAGLVLGILATVLLQSSSATTSILIAMTVSGRLEPKNAVPIVMGLNVGSCVTNTIVSIALVSDREQYRRAFAGAVVHDLLNMLTAAVLLPLEALTGVLYKLSGTLVFDVKDTGTAAQAEIMRTIANPVIRRIIQVDSSLVAEVAKETDAAKLVELQQASMIVQSRDANHLFITSPRSDLEAGWILLLVSVTICSTCVLLFVRLLRALSRIQAARRLKAILEFEIKPVPCLTDYVVILLGCLFTCLMQSSTITTSAMIPLVGIGAMRLEKFYAFSIGANLGTAVTGVTSALVARDVGVGLQVMLAQFLFSFIGFVLWFHLSCIPLSMARLLGDLAAEVRWFPLAYLLMFFGIIPGILYSLSMSGPAAVAAVALPMGILFVSLVVLLMFRKSRPNLLPSILRRNADWLPRALHCGIEPLLEVGANSSAGSSVSGPEELEAMEATSRWWQAPIAWGLGWMVVAMLLVAVPNGQWARFRPPSYDPREQVGIGAWMVCSKMYEKEHLWAPAPEPCDTAALLECSGIDSCGWSSPYTNFAVLTAMYEESWKACSQRCTMREWGDHCLSLDCGVLHRRQCHRVIRAVPTEYEVKYGRAGEVAWAAGDTCRPVAVLCDNSRALAIAGVFASAGIAFMCLGQVLLLISVVFPLWQSLAQLRRGALASFFAGSCCLLTSFSIFSATMNGLAHCIVADESGTGAVTATGRFRDIINNDGGACTDLIIASCFFGFAVTGVLAHHVCGDVSKEHVHLHVRRLCGPSESAGDTMEEAIDGVRIDDSVDKCGEPSCCQETSSPCQSGLEKLENGIGAKDISVECSCSLDKHSPASDNNDLLPDLIGSSVDFEATPVAPAELVDTGTQHHEDDIPQKKIRKPASKKRHRQLVVEPKNGMLCCIMMR